MQAHSLSAKIGGFLKQTWLVYVLAIIFGTTVVALLALLKTPEYSATVGLNIRQEFTINDPFTATKAATAVRDNLADIIHTTSFYKQVVDSGLVNLDSLEQLPEEEKRKEWERIVETESSGSSPALTIIGYDPNPGQAEAIATAVSQTLVVHGKEYHSSPDTISLLVTNDPIVSSYPTRPNLLTNGVAASVFGALLGALILFLRPSTAFSYPNRMKEARYTSDSRGDDDYSDVVDVAAEPMHAPEEVLPPPEYNVLDVTNFHQKAPVKEDLLYHPSQMNSHTRQSVVMPHPTTDAPSQEREYSDELPKTGYVSQPAHRNNNE